MEEMNCLSVRRIISTDIHHKGAAFTQHLHVCPSCKSFYERQLKFNRILTQAVEVDVPEGLAARVLVEQRIHQKTSRDKKYRWTAMAASVLLVFTVGLVSTLHSPPSLANVIVEHVKAEPELLQEQAHVSLAQLNNLLKPHGVRADASIGRATHAGNCLIQGKLGVHLVFAGKNAPVTLIVMSHQLNEDKVAIDDNEFKGVIIKTPRGVLALLSEDKESMMEFEQRLHASLMTFI